MEKRLLIVGHLNLDHIYTVNREAEERPGGGALYTAFAAGIFGSTVDLLATRCPDMPEEVLKTMHEAHINTDNVLSVLGAQRRSSMAYDSNLVRTNFAHKTEAWLRATVEQVPRHTPRMDRCYSCVYLAPMLGKNQLLYAQWGRQQGITTAMDLSEYYAQENTKAILECLRYVDIFMPSEIELNEIFPDISGNLPEQIRRVREMGVKMLIVKRSTQGSLVCDFLNERYVRVGIRKLKQVVDATGAGDSFNGGFLSCWLATGDAVQSARYAAAVASCCIQDFSYFNLLGRKQDELAALAREVPYEEVSI